MQSKAKSFKGQKIFVGIDVHSKSWSVAILTQSGYKKEFVQSPDAQALFVFLKKNFPDGDYHAVYEAGFSGLSTYYSLTEAGIDCIAIHAADVPTTQYEKTMKTDRIDAAKLARSLRNGELKGIYIRDKDSIDDRSVVRVRKTIQKQLGGYKTRVKHMLHTHGVEMPERFRKPGTQWSGAFMKWLRDDVKLLSATKDSLLLLLKQVETLRGTLLEANRMIRKLAQSERYSKDYKLLTSIPGIGVLTAMCILTEINDVKRFRNEKRFASYLGLIPTCHSSADKESHGKKTFRGNKEIGTMLIESCWVAIYKDYGLGASYAEFKCRMTPQEAIVRVARKMSNIIFAVLKNQKAYEPYKFKGE